MSKVPHRAERLLLQAAIILACLLPLLGGALGMVNGVEQVAGLEPAQRVRLDSHYRYLSGLLFALGIGFLSCVPRIERHGPRMRLLGGMVVLGGLARLYSLLTIGVPNDIHLIALGMELGVVPVLLLWQWHFARRSSPEPTERK